MFLWGERYLVSCLQASFQKLIKGLQSLDYSILDVNSHRWHDDYNKFKAGIKDLEVMLTNVIQLGFDNASSLVARIELLEACPCTKQCTFIMTLEDRRSLCMHSCFHTNCLHRQIAVTCMMDLSHVLPNLAVVDAIFANVND